MLINKEFTDNLNYLFSKIELTTTDGLNQDVLPYLERMCNNYIKWEIVTSVTWIFMMIISCILLLKICLICIDHKYINKITHDPTFYEITLIVALLILCVCVIICIVQIFDIIECIAFPEKAIYEYITSMIEEKE